MLYGDYKQLSPSSLYTYVSLESHPHQPHNYYAFVHHILSFIKGIYNLTF